MNNTSSITGARQCVRCMRLLGLLIVLLGPCCNSPDEVTLGLRVGYAVVLMRTRESHFEIFIFSGNVWMLDQIVPE